MFSTPVVPREGRGYLARASEVLDMTRTQRAAAFLTLHTSKMDHEEILLRYCRIKTRLHTEACTAVGTSTMIVHPSDGVV